MAAKKEVATTSDQQASLVVNNAFIDSLANQLNEKCKYGMQFPADYNLQNALTGAYLTLKETEDKNGKSLLESCSQASIATALMDMAVTGLSVQKKQGYFIGYGGKCQFQKSYFGNITIARRFGLKNVNAEVIYEGDEFNYCIENGRKVFKSHDQDFMNIDITKIKGAYAIAEMADGSQMLEVMNIKQLEQSWKQGYGYKAGGTHDKFKDQMAKKTVINRLCKMITNTYGDAYVSDKYDELEEAENIDIVAADVDYEIAENANKEEFVVEPDVVEAEVVEEPADVPDFAK